MFPFTPRPADETPAHDDSLRAGDYPEQKDKSLLHIVQQASAGVFS